MRGIAVALICGLMAVAPTWAGSLPALKEAYDGDFLIGAAFSDHHLDDTDPENRKELEVMGRAFNCVTPENLMKWDSLQPEEGRFEFGRADTFMAFAEREGLGVVGHVLVWHSQTPDWVFQDAAGQPVSRDVLIQRLRTHIHTVVGRYKGRITYWDVVNEAVLTREVVDETLPKDEDGNPQTVREAYWRESQWRTIIGDDYIELAFRFAHEADPHARLIYNDYNMIFKSKADFVADMVRGLRANGVAIHGVGMQGHWHLNYPSMDELQGSIGIFSSAGVKVSLTELDIGVLPLVDDYRGADISVNAELQDQLNPYRDGAPAEVLERQAQKYRSIFEVLLKNRDVVERVTFWGLSDRISWRNDWPMRGRTDYPLLFDRQCLPKPAYYSLHELGEGPRP